ncbi:hypothetical protein KA183_15195 [bacterium]|nr:hypothetical protein [bacterium]
MSSTDKASVKAQVKAPTKVERKIVRDIGKLSSSQRRALDTTLTYWRKIGTSTVPANRKMAEEGVIEAYRAVKLDPPKLFVWLDSPRAGATCVRLLKSDLDWPAQLAPHQRVVWDSVWQQCMPFIKSVVGNDKWNEIKREIKQEAQKKVLQQYPHLVEKVVKERFSEHLGIWIWKHLRKAYGYSVFEEVRNEMDRFVQAKIKDKVLEETSLFISHELVSPLQRQLEACILEPLRREMTVNNGILLGRQTWECCFGQHDAPWLSYFDYLSRLGLAEADAVSGLKKVARAAGWWWPYKNLCILTERPKQLNRENRLYLHSESGAAIEYPDGWGIYSYRGIVVPEYVINLSEPISVEMIEAEPNVEVRRVLIERFGLENYLKTGNLVKIHQDDCGILYRMNLQGDEPMLVVRVINSTPEPDGTRKNYFLRVPPNMMRARQAVAWTFGLTEDEYHPLQET